MIFYSSRLIKNEDVNLLGRPYVGRLLDWINEEAATYVGEITGDHQLLTKCLAEVDFIDSLAAGDEAEFGLELIDIGDSSITVSCILFNKENRRPSIAVNKIIFVCVDEFGLPQGHGLTLAQAA